MDKPTSGQMDEHANEQMEKWEHKTFGFLRFSMVLSCFVLSSSYGSYLELLVYGLHPV